MLITAWLNNLKQRTRSHYRPLRQSNESRRNNRRLVLWSAVELLEDKTMLSAVFDMEETGFFEESDESHPEGEPSRTIAFGGSLEVIGPHHTDPGHPGSPNTHYFASTGDAHHFAWQDQDPSTPTVIDIFYDFRSRSGFPNLITAG